MLSRAAVTTSGAARCNSTNAANVNNNGNANNNDCTNTWIASPV